MMKKIIFMISIIFILISSCYLIGRSVDIGEYKINNVNIYKNTPAWKLALAVRDNQVKTIEKIAKEDPKLLNYQEPKYGATLLLWSVRMEKYDSAEVLLKCGANPDIASTIDGKTPLFLAAGYSWIDNDAKKDPKYVKLLLSYGANPNKNYIGGDVHDNVTEPGESPLMESIGCGIEKTKALVEGGSDINYKTSTGRTAAIMALRNGGPNATLEGMEYARYLIVDKKANVSNVYSRIDAHGNIDPNQILYPVNQLRYWVYDLNSEKYKIKIKIIEEFARQGVNYWETEIPNDTINQIKKLYPNDWEEYLKKY